MQPGALSTGPLAAMTHRSPLACVKPGAVIARARSRPDSAQLGNIKHWQPLLLASAPLGLGLALAVVRWRCALEKRGKWEKRERAVLSGALWKRGWG